jgi:hypothetical protein
MLVPRFILMCALTAFLAAPVSARRLAVSGPAAQAVPTDAHAAALTGGWTLDKALSDHPADEPPQEGREGRGGEGRGGEGGFGRRGRRGGGFGGGVGGGEFGGEPRRADPAASARTREAIADILNPPDHLVIVSSDTTLILTGPDGRTTRLSTDGTPVKDENTNIERKTRWEGDQLVSEITGLPQGKITETYSIDPDQHRLRIVTLIDGRGGRSRTFAHVYDPDPR